MSAPTLFIKQLIRLQQSRRQADGSYASQSLTKDSGLSLLECLMAVAIIALTAAMITPPLFLAAATRVQNRRAEQAMQIAQGELERINVLVSQGQHLPERLPAVSGAANLRSTNVPTTISTATLDSVNPSCNTYNDQQLGLTQARPVDTDGDCRADFYMQVFRSPGTASLAEGDAGTNRPTEFELGVRVYAFLASENGTSFVSGLSPDPASLILTTGSGRQRTQPLAVLFREVVWSDRSFSLCDYHNNSGDCL